MLTLFLDFDRNVESYYGIKSQILPQKFKNDKQLSHTPDKVSLKRMPDFNKIEEFCEKNNFRVTQK